jgi:hypothetical protein
MANTNSDLFSPSRHCAENYPGSRGTSVLPSGADIVSLPQHVRLVPILLKKSFSADEQKFSASLVHPARGDMRDHIDSHKSDHRPS